MALYNNGFYGLPYQQQQLNYLNQQVQQAQQMAQQNNQIIWVQGEAGAKSYMLAPNTTVPLWDSESQKIYLKSTDASGMPSIKVLSYTIDEQPKVQNQLQNSQIDLSAYVTRQELAQTIQELKEVINGKSTVSANAVQSTAESAKSITESV